MQNYGSLSTLGKIQTLLRTTDLNVPRLALLCALYQIPGAGETSLGRALGGGKGLGPEAEKGLSALVLKLEALISRVAPPATLSFREPEKVKALLDGVAAGTYYLLAVGGLGAEDEKI